MSWKQANQIYKCECGASLMKAKSRTGTHPIISIYTCPKCGKEKALINKKGRF